MNNIYDNIDFFNIKQCKNGLNCRYLNLGMCKFKHNYIDNCNDNNINYNRNVYQSNLFAIKNNIKNNHFILEKLICSYKDVQQNLNKTKELKVKEKLLNDKEKNLELKALHLEKTQRYNDSILLKKLMN